MPFLRRLRMAPAAAAIRFVLDECLPPVLRDRHWFYRLVVRAYNPSIDIDFKIKAPSMTDDEFREAYERVVSTRDRDATDAQLDFVLEHLQGRSVLEVGGGAGDLSLRMARSGLEVTATDLTRQCVEHLRKRAQEEGVRLTCEIADVERLPFPDATFDSVACVHTLEHVRDLCMSLRELKRVGRRRLVLVVPRERYFRYTSNYHLQFFGGPDQLALAARLEAVACRTIDGAICYAADLPAAVVPGNPASD